MEFDSIRPVISGVIGGMIAAWLTSRWAYGLPTQYGKKSRETLCQQHRLAIRVANVLFFVGLCIGIALFPLGRFADADWRPFLLGFGLASVLPLAAIGVISLLSGRDIKEAYVAFAWGQGTPLWTTYGILGAGVVAFVFAVAAFVT